MTGTGGLAAAALCTSMLTAGHAEALAGGTTCTTTAVCTVSFPAVRHAQTWVVPADVLSATFTVAAGSGGHGTAGGGLGGKVSATVPVTPGHRLSLVVGGSGGNGVVTDQNIPAPGGYGGGGSAGREGDPVWEPAGGGGGGSFVFDATTGNLPLVIAGGGGGGTGGFGLDAGSGSDGGAGGAGTGAAADGQTGTTNDAPGPWVGGGGATATSPGTAGPGLFDAQGIPGYPGSGPATGPTQLGVGGRAGDALGAEYGTGGGGGGGLYGGGGGGNDGAGGYNGGGGGGSGYLVASATSVVTGTNLGNGSVAISYRRPLTPPSSVTAYPQAASGAAELGWAPPTRIDGILITGYRVSRDGVDTHGYGAWSTTLPADARSFVFTNLVTGLTYHLSVQAVSSAGTSPAATRQVTLRP